MSATEPSVIITEPGIYPDLTSADYHKQHDWLSWSSMKDLLPPKTPAHFKYAMDERRAGRREEKRHYDLGNIVHALVLGRGHEYEVVTKVTREKETVPADGYTTVSAQKHRDAIYAAGKVPVLAHELDSAQVMAAAIKDHEGAAELLSAGQPEVAIFWVDDDTGVPCRAMVDWLDVERGIAVDVKTANSSAPVDMRRESSKFGYYGQAMHYSEGLTALTGKDFRFIFVPVSKDKPHLVSLVQYDPDDLLEQVTIHAAVDRCRRLYRDCTASGVWPGYGNEVHHINLTNYVRDLIEDVCGIDHELVVI